MRDGGIVRPNLHAIQTRSSCAYHTSFKRFHRLRRPRARSSAQHKLTASSTRAAAAARPRPPRALQAPSRNLPLASRPPQHAVRACSNARRLRLHTRATSPAFLPTPVEDVQGDLCCTGGVTLSAFEHVASPEASPVTARKGSRLPKTTVHTPAAWCGLVTLAAAGQRRVNDPKAV